MLLAQVSPLSGFLISLLPQALPALWPSPPLARNWIPERGSVGKGAKEGGQGTWRLLRQQQEGAGIEESPAVQAQDGVLFGLLPCLPQGLALSPSKAGMAHLSGCSPKLPLGLFCQ